MQRFGVRMKPAYLVPALLVWGGTYAAGIHPTIAGVVVGLITPVRAWLGPEGFVTGVREEIDQIESQQPNSLSAHDLAGRLQHVDMARREALSPAESLIATLHPWVAFCIMPVFALANAGVRLSGGLSSEASWTVAAGVGLGLVLGKPLGVLIATKLVVRLGVGRLPIGLTVRHLIVLGLVAGVGFTMALFVAQLAFADAALLSAAKLGVLAASCAAALIALLAGHLVLPRHVHTQAAQTADEAEASTEH
jgi:NhaA family Na+:H+ antiporter